MDAGAASDLVGDGLVGVGVSGMVLGLVAAYRRLFRDSQADLTNQRDLWADDLAAARDEVRVVRRVLLG